MVYGQSQVTNALARPSARYQVGPMAGMGGSYTPARFAADNSQLAAPPPAAPTGPNPNIHTAQPGGGGIALGRTAAPTPMQQYGGLGNSVKRYSSGGNPAAQTQNYDYTGVGNNGVAAGAQAPNAVGQDPGNDLASIQAEMKRRQVGVQLNQDPNNSALAGYEMGQ